LLPTPSVEAFRVAADDVRAHALCVHGYTSTPFEVRVVADALGAIGVSCEAPLLRGHGRDPLELNQIEWRAWVDDVRERFVALPKPRVLVGSSMGALLSLLVAADAGDADLKALVLLSPALKFFPQGRVAGALARAGAWRLRPVVPKENKGGDIFDEHGRDMNPTYPVLPIRGVGQVHALQSEVLRVLPRITAPLCVFHGAQDHTVDPVSAEIICARVSSPFSERHVLRDSFHVIGLDVDRDVIAERAAAFVARFV
jgi:carboxylesterase